jgi:hypothetical protein
MGLPVEPTELVQSLQVAPALVPLSLPELLDPVRTSWLC